MRRSSKTDIDKRKVHPLDYALGEYVLVRQAPIASETDEYILYGRILRYDLHGSLTLTDVHQYSKGKLVPIKRKIKGKSYEVSTVYVRGQAVRAIEVLTSPKDAAEKAEQLIRAQKALKENKIETDLTSSGLEVLDGQVKIQSQNGVLLISGPSVLF